MDEYGLSVFSFDWVAGYGDGYGHGNWGRNGLAYYRNSFRFWSAYGDWIGSTDWHGLGIAYGDWIGFANRNGS